MYLSVIFGQVAILAGFGVSIAMSLPSGGSIVLVAIGLYVVSIALSKNGVTALSTR
jgi:zinc transport system permease protein